MSPKTGAKRPHGQIRQTQIITTFGPGAMLDLPKYSVLVGGLEYWTIGGEDIYEPRLTEKLKLLLDVPAIQLRTPPADNEDPTAPPTGITVWQFPEWFITQDVTATEGSAYRTRMLVHRRELTRNKFLDENKKLRPVVPVRFVRACRSGHIGDIDWYAFVHGGTTDCRRRLWMDERGTSGDLTEVWVRCECRKAEASLATAALLQNRALGMCYGARPWLGQYAREACGEPNRLLIRTASNAYFPQVMSVISLPVRDETVKRAIDSVWEMLMHVEDIAEVRYERKKARVNAALEGLSDEEVFKEIQIRRSGEEEERKSVKQAELETLLASKDEIGEDRPGGDFLARTVPRDRWERPWMKMVKRVVLVHRLREVSALVGFTRFEAMAPDIEGELEMGVRRAALAREVTWLPAIENRGEGVFLEFDRTAIETWIQSEKVKEYARRLDAGFQRWLGDHPGSGRRFVGAPYVMLHSFAHMLITAVSLECGYPASSIRERIYALPSVGYGILLYTGSSDAEGTLGGLIQVGRRIHDHVRTALESSELCSNDPVCSQHDPRNEHEQRYLHGAACHGCLLIAETSCEQHNEFLDRTLVVRTLDNFGVQFFPWPEQ